MPSSEILLPLGTAIPSTAFGPIAARRCKLGALGLNDEAQISELDLNDPTSHSTMSWLPTEIVRQILEEAVTTARYELFVCEGQFLPLPTQCSSCTYQLLAGVCSAWRDMCREILHRQITISEKTAQDADLLQLLKTSPRLASEIRSIDASCRAKNHAMADLIPPSPDSNVEAHERERAADLEKDRQLVERIVKLCPLINEFDADFGCHPILLRPGMLPSSITTLTLRNVTAKETFALLAELPAVRDLTLRMAPDWLLHEPDSVPFANVQLTRFELSATAWGETSLEALQKLLSNSSNTLQCLAIRNKSSFCVVKFAEVAQELIRLYGPRLHELSLKDVPARALRSKDFIPLNWFPSPSALPHGLPLLRRLHLTGIPSNLALFTSFKSTSLDHLTIEEFDELSGQTLLASLRQGLWPKLVDLALCGIKEGKGREGIEEWCDGENVKLIGGWKLPEVERRW